MGELVFSRGWLYRAYQACYRDNISSPSQIPDVGLILGGFLEEFYLFYSEKYITIS
jgi:hypothetical protein